MSRELTCDEAELLCLDRYAEVELDPDSAQTLDQHLAGCAECRAFTEEIGQLGQRIATAVRESPELNDPVQAEADVARVRAAINEYEAQREPAAPSRDTRGAPWGTRLVAAVALVAAGFGLGLGLVAAPDTSDGLHTAGPERIQALEGELDEEQARNKALEGQLEEAQARIKELERQLEEAKSE